MQLHRLGFPCHHPASALFNLLHLSSLSCAAAASFAAAASCAVVVSCVVNVVVERERAEWRCVTNAFFLACGAHVTKWSVRSPRVYKPLLFRCFKPHF